MTPKYVSKQLAGRNGSLFKKASCFISRPSTESLIGMHWLCYYIIKKDFV